MSIRAAGTKEAGVIDSVKDTAKSVGTAISNNAKTVADKATEVGKTVGEKGKGAYRYVADKLKDPRVAAGVGAAGGTAAGFAAGRYLGRKGKEEGEEKEKEKEASMSAEEETLFMHAYLPAFAEKCASRGVSLNEDTVGDAIDTTALLKSYIQSQNAPDNTIKSAAHSLRATLGLASPRQVKVAAASDARAKQASALLSQIPEIQAAVLGLR